MSTDDSYQSHSRRNRANASYNCSDHNNSNNINSHIDSNLYQQHQHQQQPPPQGDEQKDDEVSPLKLELPHFKDPQSQQEPDEDDIDLLQHQHSNHNNHNNQDIEEKECNLSPSASASSSVSNSLQLSYCNGLDKTPLAVPMVADTNQHSVTRNDAKIITETRLKRLKELSQRPEQTLSKDQKDEKKRIIRLEKNRRAAAMSRRKKENLCQES